MSFTVDQGQKPFVIDIGKATTFNDNYRTTLWTGKNLQLTVMSIPPGTDIGLEVHHDHDQFLRVEKGQGLAQMGDSKEHLYFNQPVFDDSAIFVPAGVWHNVINTGNVPLKLYSIYAPPEHSFGTIHATKEIAETSEARFPYSTFYISGYPY